MANSSHSWGMCAVDEHCLRVQRLLNTGAIILGKLGLGNKEQMLVNIPS